MGNGNRGGLVEGTGEKAAAASGVECDVGLGLRMLRPIDSFPNKRMMSMHPSPPHHHHHHHQHHHPCSDDDDENMGGAGFGGSGGPIYCNLSNQQQQVACFSDIYDVIGAAGSVSAAGGGGGGGGGASLVSQRTLHPFSTSDSSCFKSSGGGGGGNMPAASAKVLFTESQWQELERQTTIYKYMVDSLPVPPELLIPISKTQLSLPASQSHNIGGGLDMRFSRSSDPEPWRCRRTDGKKWRCSRDVAPNQKYCERHAHKSKPRSRKPVELPSSHNTNTNTNTNLNYTHPLVNLPPNAIPQASFQKPIFHIPTMVSGATYSQPRCTEWLMKGDSTPGSTLNRQWVQLMQSSSSSTREGLKTYNEENYRSWSFSQQHYGEQQESMNTNFHFDGQRLQHHQPNDQCRSLLDPKISRSQGGLNTDRTQTTRRFIDTWSSAEREEMDGFSKKYSGSSSGKLPLSSLTLSMSDDNGIDEESANAQLCLKSQWLDPVYWMGSPPGGPLGEALCLSIATTAKEASAFPSWLQQQQHHQ